MAVPILSVSKLSKTYDNHINALKSVSFDANTGDFLVLLGPSGCGKSTTLLLIAGLEGITSGDVFIDDIRVNDVDPKDRDIAMIFQDYTLYPHLSVRSNLAFPLKMRHIPTSEIADKIKEVTEILMIDELLDRKPHQLSGGQKQRIAIGKALVQSPRIFLMDEPFANLDSVFRNQMRIELSLLQKKINATIVYVTHDQEEALALGTQIVVMDKGKVQQTGTPETIYRHPQNVFVASFIGHPAMNMLDSSELIQKSGIYYVVIDECLIKIADPLQEELQQGDAELKSVIVGIRPEDVYISDKCLFPVTIQYIEYVGSRQHIHVIMNKRKLILTEQTNKRRRIGDCVSICFEPESLYLFDKKTHKNLDSLEYTRN